MIFLLALLSPSAPASVPPRTPTAEAIQRIESECRLRPGILKITSGGVGMDVGPDGDLEAVACAYERLLEAGIRLTGFSGNEVDPDAKLRAPARYIAQGRPRDIKALMRAAKGDGWRVVRSATASDGIAILQFESRPRMTVGEADRLLQRVWKMEFGDIAFGPAPPLLSEEETPSL
jgi:hypothetical protein